MHETGQSRCHMAVPGESIMCSTGAKQGAGGLQVTVSWADGVSQQLPYEVFKRHIVTSNALLDYMVLRVRRKRDVCKHSASINKK